MDDKTPFYFTKTTFSNFIKDLLDKFKLIKDKLNVINNTVASVSENLSTTAAQVSQNTDSINQNTSNISSLTESTNQSFADINAKLNSIEENAEANVINGIVYNNTQLTPDSNKIVTIPPAQKLKIYNTTADSALPTAEYDGSAEIILTALKLFNTTTITLAVDGWSSNEQSAAVSGMGAASLVFVSPDPSYMQSYIKSQIYAKVQSTNQLTFVCQKVPTESITVQIIFTGT